MPIPKPNKGEEKQKFVSRCMGNPVMNKEYPDNKQRAGICYSQWKDSKKEIMFSTVHGLEVKEEVNGDLIVDGYIATTHLDSGFEDKFREGVYVKDKIEPETLYFWRDLINEGNPRANKVTVNHKQSSHPAGVGIKGSARIDTLPDGELGLYVKTIVDKTEESFDDTKYRLDIGTLDSFSIEFRTRDPITGECLPEAVKEFDRGSYIERRLLPGTEFEGWTLASKPMNDKTIMFKEVIDFHRNMENKENTEEVKMTDKDVKVPDKDSEEEVEETKTEEEETDEEDDEDLEITDEEKKEIMALRIKKVQEVKEKQVNELKEKVLSEIKKDVQKMEVKEKVKMTQAEVKEVKEVSEYKEIFNKDSSVGTGEQFRRAGRLIDAKGIKSFRDLKTTPAEDRNYEFNTFGFNDNYMEFKSLGITTNQNTDTDYLLSSAELNDIFDPIIYNALNQKTIFWNLLKKEDYSKKGNNQVQFTLKTAANTTAGAYTGNAVSLGNVTRLKYQTKFKKYQVGIEVDGDMIAAARGGPIGDIFAKEVSDSMDDLMTVINADLFKEVGAETAAGIIGLEYITDSAGNTTLYNLTRSTTNKLSPASAGNTYIDGGSVDVKVSNLRAARRQAVEEGAELNNLIFVTSPIQGDKIREKYDSLQRLIPTSGRVGFEGMMTFDGIPVFEDKDCNDDDIFLVDLETHVVAIWVPFTLEMLGKDADSEKGFVKTYFAVYNRAPRRMVQIYSNAIL